MDKPSKWMLMGLLLALPAGVRGQDYQFATNGNAITITKYIGAGGAVAIPEKINGMEVTSIRNGAFALCTSLTSVTIPNGVTSIGDSMLWSKTDFLSLSSGQLDNSSSRSDIKVNGENMTILGGVFYGCTNLTSITIPNSVTKIGELAFKRCSSLTSITIPNSVISIGEGAFFACTNLKKICFNGNAPSLLGSCVFLDSDQATIYYLPTTTGWGKTFGGRPTAVWKQ